MPAFTLEEEMALVEAQLKYEGENHKDITYELDKGNKLIQCMAASIGDALLSHLQKSVDGRAPWRTGQSVYIKLKNLKRNPLLLS